MSILKIKHPVVDGNDHGFAFIETNDYPHEYEEFEATSEAQGSPPATELDSKPNKGGKDTKAATAPPDSQGDSVRAEEKPVGWVQ